MLLKIKSIFENVVSFRKRPPRTSTLTKPIKIMNKGNGNNCNDKLEGPRNVPGTLEFVPSFKRIGLGNRPTAASRVVCHASASYPLAPGMASELSQDQGGPYREAVVEIPWVQAQEVTQFLQAVLQRVSMDGQGTGHIRRREGVSAPGKKCVCQLR